MPKTTPKDIEKVKTLFQTGFAEKKTLRSLDKYTENTKMIASNYMVYSFAALPALIEKMKRISSFDEDNRYVARYTVEENGSMWFALEGSPGSHIEYSTYNPADVREQAPAHSDMTPKPSSGIIASGTIVFSKEYQIEKITNFSGHFRPYATTLVWPLAALLNLTADFTSEVELIFFWKDERKKIKHKTVSLSKDELHTLLPEEGLITSDPAYKICVYSGGAWQHYGPDQTPQFKQKQKRPATSTQLAATSDASDKGYIENYLAKRRLADNRSSFSSSFSFFPPPAVLSSITSPASLESTGGLFDDEGVILNEVSLSIDITTMEEQKADSSPLSLCATHTVNTSDVLPIAQQYSYGSPSSSPRPSIVSMGGSARMVPEPFSDSDDSETEDMSSCAVWSGKW